jgi:putative transposase
MARLPRLVVPGLPHHVVLQGHRDEPLFIDDIDRTIFRGLLRELAGPHGVAIHAYALLASEVQLLLSPTRTADLGRFVQAMGRRYVRAFNTRHSRQGSLWRARFRSTVLEPQRWLLTCMQYIEWQPVRAALVSEPHHYGWSSFAHHAGMSLDPLVSDHSAFWALGNTPYERQSAYRERFERPLAVDEVGSLERATRLGWALGSPVFIDSLTRISSRRPTPGRPGRPRKI